MHLMHAFEAHPEVKYGLTTMCVGLGQGGTVVWKNLMRNGDKAKKEKESEPEEKETKEKKKKDKD